MQSFSELNLSPSLKERLIAAKFSTPTPVQAAAIPQALEGKDVYRHGPDRNRQNAGVPSSHHGEAGAAAYSRHRRPGSCADPGTRDASRRAI